MRTALLANKPTIRLAMSYLIIIMVLSIFFSFVFYRISSNELTRQLPADSHYRFGQHDYTEFFSQRISEGKTELLQRLIYINLLTLIGGGLLSYYLARRSLAPIEQVMEAQTRFVTDASHELRTPLTALRTTNEVALRKPQLSAKEAKAIIKSNLAEAVRLTALADGLLNLLRNDEPTPLTEFDLDEAIAEAVNLVIALAVPKKITIEDNVPRLKLKSDKQKLVQIIHILLDNAVKYSPEKTKINLTAKAKGRILTVSVTDQGPGIRASDQPHIFERFYRADNARSRGANHGYGLGLAIARKLVEQLGGDIGVKSTPGRGATFSFNLPLTSQT